MVNSETVETEPNVSIPRPPEPKQTAPLLIDLNPEGVVLSVKENPKPINPTNVLVAFDTEAETKRKRQRADISPEAVGKPHPGKYLFDMEKEPEKEETFPKLQQTEVSNNNAEILEKAKELSARIASLVCKEAGRREIDKFLIKPLVKSVGGFLASEEYKRRLAISLMSATISDATIAAKFWNNYPDYLRQNCPNKNERQTRLADRDHVIRMAFAVGYERSGGNLNPLTLPDASDLSYDDRKSFVTGFADGWKETKSSLDERQPKDLPWWLQK